MFVFFLDFIPNQKLNIFTARKEQHLKMIEIDFDDETVYLKKNWHFFCF